MKKCQLSRIVCSDTYIRVKTPFHRAGISFQRSNQSQGSSSIFETSLLQALNPQNPDPFPQPVLQPERRYVA